MAIACAVIVKRNMEVSEAKYQDGCLILRTPAKDALKWLVGFVRGKDYDITPHIEKRSRNANAYAWLLITKLASELGYPKEEVYKSAVREIGGKSTTMSLRTNAVKDFKKAFVNGHIGRSVDIIGSDPDTTDIVITYGSSDFSTIQMKQLIDNLVQDCRNCGIETKDENYIKSLLEDWQYD